MKPSATPTTLRSAHAAPVTALCADRAGAYLLSASADKLLKLWRIADAAPVATLAGHGWPVHAAALSADNARIVSAGGDRAVFVWDVATARVARKLPAPQRVQALALAGDAVCAAGGVDAAVRLWDLKANARTPIQTLTHARDAVTSLAIHDHVIVTGSLDGHVRLYDLRRGEMTADRVGHPVTCARLSHDAQCLLVHSLDSAVRLFDVANGQLLNTYKGHRCKDYSITCTLDPTDAYVVAGSEDGQLYVWDLVDANVAHRLPTGHAPVLSVACDAKHLAAGSADGTIRIWEYEC